MNKLIILLCLISIPAWADDIRLICNNGSTVQEYRPNQIYDNDNLPEGYEGKAWKVYPREQLPKYQWLEQVKCSGDTFTVDSALKPSFVLRQEAIEARGAELDAALAEKNVDAVKVIKINRELEKIKANK